MNLSPGGTDGTKVEYRPDDTYDDAAAAYKEVMARALGDETDKGEKSAPVESKGKPVEGDDKASKPEKPERDDGRNERGQFKGKVDDKSKDEKPAKAEGEGEGEKKPDTEAKPGMPPSSFSIKAKADWASTPQSVRDDIAKRETEMAAGLAALKDFKDLKPWADMARQHNTTIGDSLKRYVGMEQVLRKDLGMGLAQIAQNFGLDQAKAAALFADLAQRFGHGKAPVEADPVQEILAPHLKPIMDQLQQINGRFGTQDSHAMTSRMAGLNKTMDTMAADPQFQFLPDLMESMNDLLAKGIVKPTGDDAADLKTAYELAARMNPQVHEALIEKRLTDAKEAERKKEQEAVERAKAASRSVSGTRMPGSITREARDENEPDDVEADVRRAMRQLSGG